MSPDHSAWLYIGTYAPPEAAGLFLFQWDEATGRLDYRDQVTGEANPSYLALHPSGRFLYAVNEVSEFQGQPGGGVSAFAVQAATGQLTLLNRQRSEGKGPCHLTTDREGRVLLVANYDSGSLAVYALEADGRLRAAGQVVQHAGRGVNPERQEGPHAHSITLAPDNRFALSCDLGLDRVTVYRLDAVHGQLQLQAEVVVSPGAGPRHLAFHPAGQQLYLVNELASTLAVYAYTPETGALALRQTLSMLPEGYAGPNTSAAVAVHPGGGFVYGSNRGHDSLVIYAVDSATGGLTLVGHESARGRTPRDVVIDPTGAWLLAANQDSDTVVIFHIDAHSGRLRLHQQIEIPRPVCLKFLTGFDPD
jgi:6-phosphogluconolactonase